MKKIHLFSAFAMLLSSSAFAQSDPTFHLPAGKTFRVENKLETTSSTDVQGQTMESKANITSTYKIAVKSASGSNDYQLANTLTHIVMNMTMMGNDLNFNSDSSKDMDGEFGSALKDYINKPKEIEVDRTGKIVSADSTDTSAGGIAARLNLAQTGYGTQLAFLPLPAHPKEGSSWTQVNNSEGMRRTTHYTIKEITGNIATISFNGTDSVETTMEQQGMEIGTKTHGTMVGEEKVDVSSGVIRSASYNGDASGTVSAMGQEFPMKTKITSSTTVTEL